MSWNREQRLLVVDDEEFSLSLLIRHLEKGGFANVESAGDGSQALEKLRQGGFDLVLLDVKMPEPDGLAVLRAVKSDMGLRDVPVIMISGVEEMDSIVKCIELGAEDYLFKPFSPTMLGARIGACLEKKRLHDLRASHLIKIQEEKKKSDAVLSVILPSAISSELKASGKVTPRRYDNIAILFCDIVGFTSFSEKNSPEDVVRGLQDMFTRFEIVTRGHGMEKIKTIGDEFMIIAGMMTPDPTPLLSAVKCGHAMVTAARESDNGWEVRVGVDSGPVVAGIVGDEKYQFDVWGNTVNMAARMTGQASPGTVAMTYDSWLRVQDGCEGRSLGRVEIKGKGMVEVVECTAIR